jgi:uncharacterized protein with PQ loop repeat
MREGRRTRQKKPSVFQSRQGNAIVEIHTHFVDKLAVVNGVVSGLALYPQVFKVLATGAYEGVSTATFAILLLNNIVWAVYALHRGLISLLIASILNILAAGVLLLAVAVQHGG